MFDWNEELNKILDEHHTHLKENSDWDEEKTNDLIARGKRERTQEIVKMMEGIMKDYFWDNGECSICGFMSTVHDESHYCYDYNEALSDLFKKIKSN
jgi:sulfur relay (sulfurtransferase) DsrC/TusE family protein